MVLKIYVAAVAVAATAVGVFAALTVPSSAPENLGYAVLLGALLMLAELLQIRRFHDGEQVGALNLIEGILAPLVLFYSGRTVVVVVALALLVADMSRSNNRLKVAFNVAQWTLAAGVASLVAHALGGSDGLSLVPLAVVVIVAMSVVNQTAITAVLAIATGAIRAPGPRRRNFLAGIMERWVSSAAALTTGICLTALYRWSPWLVSLGAVVLLGLAAAGRANVAVRADHARLQGLQRATHALAMSLDVAGAVPVFLEEARRGFEVTEIQLVLFGPAATSYRCTATGCQEEATAADELAQLVAGVSGPTRMSVHDDAVGAAIAATGHSRVLVVPLQAGAERLGLILLFDRVGMEGFEEGELTIADALGRELVGFLERVQLMQAIEEERRKLADILGATSDGIFSIESDGTVTSWNAGLAAMTGYPAEEVVGTRHIALLRPRDASGRDVLLERWAEHAEPAEDLPQELQIVSTDGATVWVSCSYSSIAATDNSRAVLVVVARNITQARELERLKDDFVAVVSHELRTPLVPIKGWAQTLLNRGDRLSDDQRRTAVQSILAQAQKLESLVLNILEASRIEAGRSDGDGAADVAGIAARLVEDTLASRPERVVRLRPPAVPCTVKGSTVWVERAVSNLLANAIKYSPDDEPVDVVITAEGDDVLVAVTDRGPGIAPDAQERIFERFERLEETRKQTGTGLGLYITRRLARAMGGDVTVSSVPGAGSTFLLRLPLAPVAASARLPEQRAARRGKGDDEDRPANVVRLR